MSGGGVFYYVTVTNLQKNSTEPSIALVSIYKTNWFGIFQVFMITDSYVPVEIPKPEVSPAKKVIPPRIGIGSEEDTMASVLNLIPKQPRK